jgi:hypothetical protein
MLKHLSKQEMQSTKGGYIEKDYHDAWHEGMQCMVRYYDDGLIVPLRDEDPD